MADLPPSPTPAKNRWQWFMSSSAAAIAFGFVFAINRYVHLLPGVEDKTTEALVIGSITVIIVGIGAFSTSRAAEEHRTDQKIEELEKKAEEKPDRVRPA